MTWTNPATLGVTSITGTANQITASASTGAVTLSFPSTVGIGTNSVQSNTALTLTGSQQYAQYVTGTLATSSSNLYGLALVNTFSPTTSGNSYYELYAAPHLLPQQAA